MSMADYEFSIEELEPIVINRAFSNTAVLIANSGAVN